jgi:glycine C-acetyltransferase
MFDTYRKRFENELEEIRNRGLYKEERVLTSPQGARISVESSSETVINMCANNYLGLSDHPEVIDAAKAALDTWGYGLSSVRFICGTQEIHKELERRISDFLGADDTILYSSCFDANGGLFETLLSAEDAVLSDALNHASIIDGIRLSKARRYVFKASDMEELESKLKEAREARLKLIATDGVFSMDGSVARLDDLCDLAERYGALVMIDDSHGVGVLGRRGRGSHEHCDVMERVDIITGTLGKALGGASGGYTSGRQQIIDLLRQRSRPYLFSNTLAPPLVAASLKALDILEKDHRLLERLQKNTHFFRKKMAEKGFRLKEGPHPIVPIMLGDAGLAQGMARALLEVGVYVIGFSYPVVPEGQARIRVQISAAHSVEDLVYAVDRFDEVRKKFASRLPTESE